MALTDHVAILAHSSLDAPSINRLNPSKPAAFYAQIAFPPAAGAELQAILSAVAPGGSLAGQEIGAKRNDALAKPLPGVPGDWIVARASTQYAPYVADGAGVQMDQNNPASHALIKSTFYAGKHVRAALTAFAWNHTSTGRKGISFNLTGIMAAADGERLNIGGGVVVNQFSQYANPAAAAVAPAPAQVVEQAPQGNPFATQQAQAFAAAIPAAVSANPFAQTAAPASANPFA